jgi:hypothetical protein
MTDRIPQIGDVIRYLTSKATRDFLFQRTVTEGNLHVARELVASGRWVIVEPKQEEEQG